MYTTKHTTGDQAHAPPTQKYQCTAYGCPLAGGSSPSSGPEARFYCRFHGNAEPDNWNQITLKLNINLELVRHLQLMSQRSSDAYWLLSREHLADREQAYSFPSYPKAPEIDHFDYVGVLNAELSHRVLGTRRAGPITKPIEKTIKPTTWKAATDYLPASITRNEVQT